MTDSSLPLIEVLKDPAAFEARPQEWKRFARAFLVVFSVGLLLTASFNIVVNPRAEFGHRLVEPIVTDAPVEKARSLRAMEDASEVLVLGTSRAAVLQPVFDGRAGFNMAIPGGNLPDLADGYAFAVREGGQPSIVVLGLDSFQLAEANHERDSIFGFSSAGWEFQGERRSVTDWAKVAGSAVSFSYTYDSLRALQVEAFGAGDPYFDYEDNGVQTRPREDKQRAAGTFDLDRQINATWHNVGAHYPDDAVASGEAMRFVREFVASLAESGVEVHVFLTPFQPRALARLEAMPGFVTLDTAARELLLDLCATGADVHDYTDVDAFGGDPEAFYDSYHLTPENAERLRSALESGVASAC